MTKHLTTWMIVLTLVFFPSGVAAAKGPKYAKAAIDRVAGKCVGSILGGALLGALIGRVVGGKRGTGTGAVVGAASGTAICAILIANARHRDRIMRAQMAAAASPGRPVSDSWVDDKGQPTAFTAQAGPMRIIDSTRLTPVRYSTGDGSKSVAPPLDTGGRECRPVGGSLSNATSNAIAPEQLYCRTSDGDWQPYAEDTA